MRLRALMLVIKADGVAEFVQHDAVEFLVILRDPRLWIVHISQDHRWILVSAVGADIRRRAAALEADGDVVGLSGLAHLRIIGGSTEIEDQVGPFRPSARRARDAL